MSTNNNRKVWILLVACYLLWPSLLFCGTHSTPIQQQKQQQTTRRGRATRCAHESIVELIKKSPIIVKALGAHIFTDDNDGYAHQLNTLAALAAMEPNKLQNAQNNFLTSAMSYQTVHTATTGEWHGNESATTPTPQSSPIGVTESILITLTPETIYKGASLLKMTPGAESAARSGNGAGGGIGSRTGGAATYNSGPESSYQYEGQLNATLQPLSCFDSNLLRILPTELIAFGKLVTVQQQQQQQQQKQQRESTQHTTGQPMDILYISINGLHRWTPQFENHIWKHLGWDHWSDFTLCSVTCGKGVQQRFRRCLLDNPMVNLNMQLNLNSVNDDDDDDDGDAVDDETLNGADALSMNEWEEQRPSTNDREKGRQNLQQLHAERKQSNEQESHQIKPQSKTNSRKNQPGRTSVPNGIDRQADYRANVDVDNVVTNVDSVADDGEVMRTFIGSFDSSRETEWTREKPKARKVQKQANHPYQQPKHRKSAKTFSTMFCEGYNIEQRNCNTFECSDDISDLLKFYKKFPLPEDTGNAVPIAMQPAPTDANTTPTTAAALAVAGTAMPLTDALTAAAADMNAISSAVAATAGATSAAVLGSAPSHTTNTNGADNLVGTFGVGNLLPPSSTPANMGYVRSWRNALNFTIMLTLRVKNDSSTATTIFSIRNITHNLYLDSYKDGLRLYLERDSATEMLPVKFNLYDYRWHQVAISIQNGDFISIYVDCSWSNSFVVSKRLYSLPLEADVEIGRGFNGELQQLLVLPDNQERHQCSNKRTSINEVKRYIIDTFIDDYSN